MKGNDIRKGQILLIDGDPCRVMEAIHRTPGNLRAFVQAKLRNLRVGNSFDQRFSATENIDSATLDKRTLQVMYSDDAGVHVMDTETYEQYALDLETVGDAGPWMEPGMEVTVEWYETMPVSIDLPSVVELEIVETAPTMRTATKSASAKPAVFSNGQTIKVPEFVNEGDRVRVDPRTGAYLERAK